MQEGHSRHFFGKISSLQKVLSIIKNTEDNAQSIIRLILKSDSKVFFFNNKIYKNSKKQKNFEHKTSCFIISFLK